MGTLSNIDISSYRPHNPIAWCHVRIYILWS